jgi:type II secretory pathway component PulJ
MSISIEVRAEREVLYVAGSGQFALADARQKFLRILDAVDQNNATKILFDGRAVKGNPETIERFWYGEFTAEAVNRYMIEGAVRRAPQFAYVLHEPVLDPRRLGETVAVNRGMWVKAFDNLEDAREWLQLPRDDANLSAG